jgi:hypothetical protein
VSVEKNEGRAREIEGELEEMGFVMSATPFIFPVPMVNPHSWSLDAYPPGVLPHTYMEKRYKQLQTRATEMFHYFEDYCAKKPPPQPEEIFRNTIEIDIMDEWKKHIDDKTLLSRAVDNRIAIYTFDEVKQLYKASDLARMEFRDCNTPVNPKEFWTKANKLMNERNDLLDAVLAHNIEKCKRPRY